jgi:hypothetical protein
MAGWLKRGHQRSRSLWEAGLPKCEPVLFALAPGSLQKLRSGKFFWNHAPISDRLGIWTNRADANHLLSRFFATASQFLFMRVKKRGECFSAVTGFTDECPASIEKAAEIYLRIADVRTIFSSGSCGGLGLRALNFECSLRILQHLRVTVCCAGTL